MYNIDSEDKIKSEPTSGNEAQEKKTADDMEFEEPKDLEELYEALEKDDALMSFIENDELDDIVSDVERLENSDDMERILEQDGLMVDDPVRMYLKEI